VLVAARHDPAAVNLGSRRGKQEARRKDGVMNK
jgi:hypothetical protein